jgi:hypothetical protein
MILFSWPLRGSHIRGKLLLILIWISVSTSLCAKVILLIWVLWRRWRKLSLALEFRRIRRDLNLFGGTSHFVRLRNIKSICRTIITNCVSPLWMSHINSHAIRDNASRGDSFDLRKLIWIHLKCFHIYQPLLLSEINWLPNSWRLAHAQWISPIWCFLCSNCRFLVCCQRNLKGGNNRTLIDLLLILLLSFGSLMYKFVRD